MKAKKSSFSKRIRQNRLASYLFRHKIIAISSMLIVLVAISALFFTGTATRLPLFNKSQTTTTQVVEQPLIDNPELLSGIGITQEAIQQSPNVGITQGRCPGDKTYYYDQSSKLSITTRVRDGSYICTTYEVNTVKTYVKSNGDQVTEETHANADTGTRQTIKTTQKTDGTTSVNANYEAPDGSGMGWGGSGEERCFGPNNTVCTMVDTGVGPTFITMLQTCIIVSTGDGYWRLGTPADNLSANTLADGSSCASWQNYKNLFYNK